MVTIAKTSTEVKNRWKQRNYKQYNVSLRYDSDMDLIEYVEAEKKKGKGTSEIFKEGISKLKED